MKRSVSPSSPPPERPVKMRTVSDDGTGSPVRMRTVSDDGTKERSIIGNLIGDLYASLRGRVLDKPEVCAASRIVTFAALGLVTDVIIILSRFLFPDPQC
jgi:hypothetical protein